MKQRNFVKKRATCPRCGETVTWKMRPGVKRFQPKLKRCNDCGKVWR